MKKWARKVFAIVIWFILWEIGARKIGNDILLASPIQVGKTLLELIVQVDFWKTIGFSSARIILGFILGVVIGMLFSVISFLSPFFQDMISPLIKVIKAMPVASFIILALVWISSKNLSVLISFLMVLPIVYSNGLQGLKGADHKLLQMAQVFQVSRWKKIKGIYTPAIIPYLLSAISVGMGMGFKAGIAAEVIAYPVGSIGRKLYESKLYLMTKELFAWSIVIITISVILERLVLRIIHGIQNQGFGRKKDEDKAE